MNFIDKFTKLKKEIEAEGIAFEPIFNGAFLKIEETYSAKGINYDRSGYCVLSHQDEEVKTIAKKINLLEGCPIPIVRVFTENWEFNCREVLMFLDDKILKFMQEEFEVIRKQEVDGAWLRYWKKAYEEKYL